MYLRSAQGYGNECNLLTFPLNYKPSIVTGLTFAETWLRREPKWQSKDLIILFYEELDYALSIREFLENYHYQEINYDQSASGSNSESRNFFNTRIEGRCGYLRQAYSMMFSNEYDFNKFSLFVDGVNA